MSKQHKVEFYKQLQGYIEALTSYVETQDGQWTIKGFVDTYKRVYTISSDTKIISKILEIHLFPKFIEFAEKYGYKIVLADHQNYYPDITFIEESSGAKFAIDFKTTYRLPKRPDYCNGFTLGSHGEYFTNRSSTKNIQFPYKEYSGHFCLGIIYSRFAERDIDETKFYPVDKLDSIDSVIKDFDFFVVEKWRIASDKRGSGNTANIGSISHIGDIKEGRGLFSKLGECWFDDYWMNYGKITHTNDAGETSKITALKDFVAYRGGDASKIVPKRKRGAKP